MSLFRVKDLWSADCGTGDVAEEDADSFWCLTVGDLEGRGRELLILGCHDGHLKILDPLSDWEDDNGGDRPVPKYKPTDLLIETQLAHPILQVAVGKLVSGSKNDHIGILHPRSIAVYSLITVTGSAEHGDQCQLYLAYEHQLKRCGYNMLVGGFGGVTGRDFLCVQSLDGALMFFEQETLALTRSLPNFLLPSPIAYVPHTDSFVVVNSDWFLESYRYQILGEESSKKVAPSWSYNIGESPIDIHSITVTTNRAAIVVVTQSSLLCFREMGSLEFAKRLAYTPIVSLAYAQRDSTNVMTLLVSDTNTLMIYEQTMLKWSALLHMCPIAISRANLRVVESCLAVVYKNGSVECCYLGTEPQTFVPPPPPSSQQAGGTAPTVAQLEAKLGSLQHDIGVFMQTNKNPLEEATGGSRIDVKLTMKAWLLDLTTVGTVSAGSTVGSPGGGDTCRIEITATPVVPVENCEIVLNVQPPFVASPTSHFIYHLGDTMEFYSYVTVEDDAETCCPWDAEATAVASYFGCGGSGVPTPGVATSTVQLPLTLVLQLVAPVKDSPIKLTLGVSQTFALPALFPEFPAELWNSSGSGETLAGFRYRSAPEFGFTVALSRHYSKYRLETDNVLALALPTIVLARKLGGKRLETHQHTIAVKELLEQAERNVNVRNTIRTLQKELKDATSQYRAVQRRILTKLRDKIPTDIDHLHKLMNRTHDEVLEYTHGMEKAHQELSECGSMLGSLIKLTISLCRLSPTTCKEDVENLSHALSYTSHYYTDDQGWAEATESALTHLLRTSLARTVQDEQRVLERDHHTKKPARLRTLIATAIDRVANGQHKQHRVVSPIMEGEEDDAARRRKGPSRTPSVSAEDNASV